MIQYNFMKLIINLCIYILYYSQKNIKPTRSRIDGSDITLEYTYDGPGDDICSLQYLSARKTGGICYCESYHLVKEDGGSFIKVKHKVLKENIEKFQLPTSSALAHLDHILYRDGRKLTKNP